MPRHHLLHTHTPGLVVNPSPEALQEMKDAQEDRADTTMDNLVRKLSGFLETLLKDNCGDICEEDREDARRRSKTFCSRPSGVIKNSTSKTPHENSTCNSR